MGTRVLREALTPFGVQVDVDVLGALSDIEKHELRQLYRQDGLLVFRNVHLSMAQQLELCRIFGPVVDSPYENFYVSNTRKDGHLGNMELQWHNDVPYLPRPYVGAALHAIEVAPGASSTRFASGFRAYERLPLDLRSRIDGLNALQVKQRHSERSNLLTDLKPGDLCAVHGVVGRQEWSGRPYVYVNQNMTASVIGLGASESSELLAELFEYLYVSDDVYEHTWHPGDLVLWDNLAIQHARGRISNDARTLQRVSLTDLRYDQQYAADVSIHSAYGNASLRTTAA